MSLLSALNMSSAALGVHQTGIDIVSNNISNMNTEGYSKQKANLGTLTLGIPMGDVPGLQAKTSCGVELINVSRYETSFLGSYYREEITEQSYLDEQSKALGDIVNMFDELKGNGLDSALTDFYASLDNLNQNPADMDARVNFIDNAAALAQSMNRISSDLNKLKNSAVGDGTSVELLGKSGLGKEIVSLNSTLDNLVSINKQLISSQTGTLENNNLLDRRDMLLKDLSKFANFETEIMDNGTVNLSIDGTELVKGATLKASFGVQTAAQYDAYCQATGLTNTNKENAVIMLKKDDGQVIQNMNDRISSGTLGAILENAAGEEGITANSVLKDMDNLANTIANIFNEIQTREGAFYIDNSSGKPQLSNEHLEDYKIFVDDDASGTITAGNITINPLLKDEGGYNKIATAYFPDYDPLVPESVDKNAVGNSDNVKAMVDTLTNTSGVEFAPIGNLSLTDYYSGLLSQVVSASSTANNNAEIQNNIVASLDSKAKAETSVDLNEELTDLVRFQTAYNASARVFSTCNILLDTLVNLGR